MQNARLLDKYYEEAQNFFKKKEFTQAIIFFDKVITLDPGFSAAYYFKAVSLNELGRKAEAIEFCEQAVSLSPDFADKIAKICDELKSKP